ncbi:LptE family protein [Aquirufa aurantiipilula]|uniref:LptE family protein n=1 Tax=Aquirufa aurantiipilula TaxID=2696561 RepID=A0ABT6BHJ6_9BACT|nr:LptE family protein [Aquirufa aurantiipilula]MDF5689779.1 LptE family protein [Aquirufa aurantiipilula]
MIWKILPRLFVLIGLLPLFSGCYSFKGASLSPELKTIQISNIRMETAGGPANLSLDVNERLKEYFQRNTSLKLTTQAPDLLLEGTIVGYELSPQAPTSDDKAGLNRLTLRIQFRLTNRLDENKNFDQEFSFYQDFPQNQTLNQVEKTLIPKLVDQIILDLFNKIAGDW